MPYTGLENTGLESDPRVRLRRRLVEVYGMPEADVEAAIAKFQRDSGKEEWRIDKFDEWYNSSNGPGGESPGGESPDSDRPDTAWVDFEPPDRTDPEDIDMPTDAPEWEGWEHEDMPGYERPEDAEFGEAYERGEFYSFTEGDYEKLEENIFTSFMRKVEPTIEAEMSERGLGRSSDFERAIGGASVEGAERATMARYGLQESEQARQTAWTADQQLLEWQSRQDIISQQRKWEDEQTRMEHMSGVAQTGARNEYEQSMAQSKYGAEWGQYQSELAYKSTEAARRSQEDWQRSMADYQNWLNIYSAATGEVTRPIEYYPYSGPSYMGSGDSPVAAGVGGAASAWTEYLKRGAA